MNKVYCCFPGGKHKALTMSYDDGRIYDRQLVEIFNRHGIKGTFHLNSGLFQSGYGKRVQPEEIAELYKGHEVACHTATHPTVARCPLPEVIEETLSDRRALERIVGYPVRGMSYPNGSYSAEIKQAMKNCGIEYSRTVGSTDSFALPEDLMEWRPTCHHNHNLMELGKQFTELHKKQYLYLMYVWGHSYEFGEGGGFQPMEEFCSMMGGRDDIWYCTNIEFVDAMKTFKSLQFAADNSFVHNPSAASAFISVNDAPAVEVKGGATILL
ncbi:MAG: polysaccharide deacetylase family protein [Eubacteriales bacterium]|nr:polysaccharide deacetylase family protein [Eubacteriales bacterium]MDD3881837.1 polysaccharide deacetylase family protein [Eubacteriales bacterium]MDD4512917.1 polysaccharide deacetylase family protein [Eubacteriales bacterium]